MTTTTRPAPSKKPCALCGGSTYEVRATCPKCEESGCDACVTEVPNSAALNYRSGPEVRMCEGCWHAVADAGREEPVRRTGNSEYGTRRMVVREADPSDVQTLRGRFERVARDIRTEQTVGPTGTRGYSIEMMQGPARTPAVYRSESGRHITLAGDLSSGRAHVDVAIEDRWTMMQANNVEFPRPGDVCVVVEQRVTPVPLARFISDGTQTEDLDSLMVTQTEQRVVLGSECTRWHDPVARVDHMVYDVARVLGSESDEACLEAERRAFRRVDARSLIDRGVVFSRFLNSSGNSDLRVTWMVGVIPRDLDLISGGVVVELLPTESVPGWVFVLGAQANCSNGGPTHVDDYVITHERVLPATNPEGRSLLRNPRPIGRTAVEIGTEFHGELERALAGPTRNRVPQIPEPTLEDQAIEVGALPARVWAPDPRVRLKFKRLSNGRMGVLVVVDDGDDETVRLPHRGDEVSVLRLDGRRTRLVLGLPVDAGFRQENRQLWNLHAIARIVSSREEVPSELPAAAQAPSTPEPT